MEWVFSRYCASRPLTISGLFRPPNGCCAALITPRSTTCSLLLVGIWATACAGMGLKLACPGRFERLAILLYLGLGWSGLIAYERVVTSLEAATVWLLASGGVLYSAGVVFHLWERLRFQNAIWHAFVLAAATCHFAAVFALHA